MGRPRSGWRLRRKGEVWCVRFTIAGRQVERSTGEADRERAAIRAAEIYSLEIRNPKPRRERPEVDANPVALLKQVECWLRAEEKLRDDRTNETYALYARAHWASHFGSLSGITRARIDDYCQVRLGRVAASSVSKELGALRAFLRWLGSDLEVPNLPTRAVGSPVESHWRGAQEVAPAEVVAILEALQSPARERYTFAYETSLRGETIDALKLDVHWHKGSSELVVTDEIDKARFGRLVPLSERAIEVLTTQATTADARGGLLFGTNRSRKLVKRAGVAVLGPERGRRLVPTDLRAGRLTHLLEAGASLPGVQYLAGHKNVTTTARYIKANARAALDAIKKGSRSVQD